jgi:GTP-binding protein
MLFRSLRFLSNQFPISSSSSDSDSALETITKTTEQITQNVLKLNKPFIDFTEIEVHSGNGGNGCYTFIRNRGFRGVFPAGGNGGAGGDVWITTSPHKKTLKMLKAFKAENGENGQGKDMHGKGGEDSIITVPFGTIIREVNKFGKTRLLASLDKPEDKIKVAEGGKGGKGNKEHSQITEAGKGEAGKRKRLQLELKLIADIGFVGFPNAGKTTLLAALTRACPKIASYPFTTLQPYVGILDFIDGLRITVADMPGIIEGAAEGKGLGHDFLKHIQRTKGLVYVLDINDSPGKTLLTLYNELQLFDEKLVRKPFTIALNKADAASEPENIQKTFGEKSVIISARYGRGLPELVKQLREIVESFQN